MLIILFLLIFLIVIAIIAYVVKRIIGGKKGDGNVINITKAEQTSNQYSIITPEKIAEQREKNKQQEEKIRVQHLIQQLNSKSIDVRIKAAKTLGEIGDKSAIEPLTRIFKPENRYERWAVAKALEKLNWQPQDNTTKALHLLVKEDWVNLKKIGGPSVEILIQELKYSKLQEGIEIIKVLGEIGDKKAVEEVIYYLFNTYENWHTFPQELKFGDNMKPLFEDYTDYILESAICDYECISDLRERKYNYDLNNAEEAVKKLCEINTPISNNILNIIAQREDINVLRVSGDFDDYDILSFKEMREIAKEELSMRGNPSFDTSIYLDSEAWKLSRGFCINGEKNNDLSG